MPISRSMADRGGFKILWAKAPRQFKSDSRHIFNIKSKTVDLPERSKGTGLGPVMFACAGSNPAVNTPDLICSITNVPIAQWLRRLSTEQEILGSSPSRDYSLLAQLVERGSNKPKVSGSSPL